MSYSTVEADASFGQTTASMPEYDIVDFEQYLNSGFIQQIPSQPNDSAYPDIETPSIVLSPTNHLSSRIELINKLDPAKVQLNRQFVEIAKTVASLRPEDLLPFGSRLLGLYESFRESYKLLHDKPSAGDTLIPQEEFNSYFPIIHTTLPSMDIPTTNSAVTGFDDLSLTPGLARSAASKRSSSVSCLDEENVLPVAKKRRTSAPGRKSSRTAVDIEALTTSMEDDEGLVGYAHSMKDFCNRLLNTKASSTTALQVVSGNQARDNKFSSAQAHEITEYFFIKCIGNAAQSRLRTFVKGCREPLPPSHEVSGRRQSAQRVADNADIPPKIRAFCATLFVVDSRKNTDPITKYIADIECARLCRARWEALCAGVNQKDNDLMEYCRIHGIQVKGGRGRDSRSVCHDMLSRLDPYHFKNNKIKQEIEVLRGIEVLMQELGSAFILVTPPGGMHELKQFGVERFRQATEILKQQCPLFEQITSLLDAKIWKPYQTEGAPFAAHLSEDNLTIHERSLTLVEYLEGTCRST